MNFSDTYNNFIAKIGDCSKYSYDEIKQLIHEAKEVQNQYDNLQLVVKCDANSLYGVCASIYYSLADFDIAEDITMTGKRFAVIVDRAINTFFVNWGQAEIDILKEFYPNLTKVRQFTEYVPDSKNDLCVYGDTDSRYIDLGRIYSLMYDENGNQFKIPESDEELANFAIFLDSRFFREIIKSTIDAETTYRNMRPGFLKMNHEITTRKTIFQAKKKYIMVGIWKDGKLFQKPKLTFKGVELKKGGSSPKIKKILSKLIDKFLLENYSIDDLRIEVLKIYKYIKTKKEKDFIYLISSVSGLKEISKDSSGVYTNNKNHIQMQISLAWYNFIENNELQQEQKPPFEGQKMNYFYCDENSPYKVIGIPDDVNMNKIKNLPEPDWNRMLNATLVKPLLRYIYDKKEIDDIDVEHFLLGVKQLKF